MTTPKTARREVDQEIGRRLRNARLARGLSQEQLGAVLGVTFQQIQKYENGRNRVATSTMLSIAAALQVPVATLLPDQAETAAPDELVLERGDLEVIAGLRRLRGTAHGAWLRKIITSAPESAHG